LRATTKNRFTRRPNSTPSRELSRSLAPAVGRGAGHSMFREMSRLPPASCVRRSRASSAKQPSEVAV
jgi:hypothetical protein